MNINLHIERLVLDGIPLSSGQRPLLQAAVEAELTRLLASGPLSPLLCAGGATPALPAPRMHIKTGDTPHTLGRQIARAVHAGLNR